MYPGLAGTEDVGDLVLGNGVMKQDIRQVLLSHAPYKLRFDWAVANEQEADIWQASACLRGCAQEEVQAVCLSVSSGVDEDEARQAEFRPYLLARQLGDEVRRLG